MSSTAIILTVVISQVLLVTAIPMPDFEDCQYKPPNQTITLCYKKSDNELKTRLTEAASKCHQEIIVIPIQMGGSVLNVGALPTTFNITRLTNCSLCIDFMLDHDANRFPQHLLITRVVETDYCRSLFLNHNIKVTVLKRESKCTEYGEETWAAAIAVLPYIEFDIQRESCA